MKKIICLIMILVMGTVFFTACSTNAENEPEPSATAESSETEATPFESADFNIGVLQGPTGMGMSKLMKDAEENKYSNNYNVELFSAPTDVTGLIINGELDVAALPTNLAATLYNKTGGNIQIIALNTLGVLYILEKGDTIHSIKDLNGKKICSSGAAATPEFALNYVLKANNVECETEYFATHAELAAQALAGNADIILIPEPQVSTIMSKSSDFRIAVDFNEAWNDATDNSSYMSMGCIAVRREFADKNGQALEQFIKDYAESVEFVNNDPSEGGKLIAQYGIVPSAEIAEKAIPNAKIVTVTGEEMKNKTDGFLKVLFDSDPKSIGGALPNEDFYR